MCRNEEYEEVAKLARTCKANEGFNLSKLSEDQKSKLEKLYQNLSQKMGYYVPELPSRVSESLDQEVNKEVRFGKLKEIQVLSQVESVRNTRLQEFLRQFP